MSWLFGVIGNRISQRNVQKYTAIHDNHLYQFISAGEYYFAAGGYPKTCFAGEERTSKYSFWIGLGLFLNNDSGRSVIFSREKWKNLSKNKAPLTDLDGHFIFLSFHDGQFDIRTDSLGLRTIYWTERNNEIILSTRLDWIAKYSKECEIDFQVVGSRWLLFNQLSYKSLLGGVNRLGPGGHLLIRKSVVTKSDQPFTPKAGLTFSINEIVDSMRAYVTPILEENRIVTLGMSGGVDSRVLLSILLKTNRENFQTHTFGEIFDPDVFLPKKIAEKESFINISYNEPFPSLSELIRNLKDYISQTNLVEPISTMLLLRNYSALNSQKYFLIDGGFGEIARRQYLNKLAFGEKEVFRGKNIRRLREALSTVRSDIFAKETGLQMERGVSNEIEYMLTSMPDIREMGLENYLDLWAIRTRLPNYSCDEQTRLDGFIQNFMPFAQLNFLHKVFSIPVKLRANGNLFRKIIISEYPALSRYPLAKNGMTYPFSLSAKTAWVYTKMKSRLGLQFKSTTPFSFLEKMKEFILDTLHSRDVKEYPAYDYRKIQSIVENYFDGNTTRAREIYWWLTFEVWRSNLLHG